MARTSKLTQLKNSYNDQINSLKAQLARSRMEYFAHGERTYFFMLFIIIFLVSISLLIAWAAGAFDPVDNAVEDGDVKKTCGDGKVCDTGFTCKNGVCDENSKDGDPCAGVQLSDCQRCEDGKTRKVKFFEGKPKCWKGEWGVIFGSLMFLIVVGVVVYYRKSIVERARFLILNRNFVGEDDDDDLDREMVAQQKREMAAQERSQGRFDANLQKDQDRSNAFKGFKKFKGIEKRR